MLEFCAHLWLLVLVRTHNSNHSSFMSISRPSFFCVWYPFPETPFFFSIGFCESYMDYYYYYYYYFQKLPPSLYLSILYSFHYLKQKHLLFVSIMHIIRFVLKQPPSLTPPSKLVKEKLEISLPLQLIWMSTQHSTKKTRTKSCRANLVLGFLECLSPFFSTLLLLLLLSSRHPYLYLNILTFIIFIMTISL